MSLPWVRLDSNISTHDKILSLLADPSAARWQAAASYMFALGWCGGHGTDGKIPTPALGFVHGSTKTARLLQKYRLWDECPGGYTIVNYAERQQLKAVSDATRKAQSRGAQKANCTRHHGPDCWQNGECGRAA